MIPPSSRSGGRWGRRGEAGRALIGPVAEKVGQTIARPRSGRTFVDQMLVTSGDASPRRAASPARVHLRGGRAGNGVRVSVPGHSPTADGVVGLTRAANPLRSLAVGDHNDDDQQRGPRPRTAPQSRERERRVDRGAREEHRVEIDLPADLNFVDDDGLVLAPVPPGAGPRPGDVVVAGTPFAWTRTVVTSVDDGWVSDPGPLRTEPLGLILRPAGRPDVPRVAPAGHLTRPARSPRRSRCPPTSCRATHVRSSGRGAPDAGSAGCYGWASSRRGWSGSKSRRSSEAGLSSPRATRPTVTACSRLAT